MTARENTREADEGALVATLNARWRVIAGDVQWVMQKLRPSGDWASKYYFRSRAGLLLYARGFEVDAEPEAIAVLERLPEHFPEKPRESRKEAA
jgi:hypothetical protein